MIAYIATIDKRDMWNMASPPIFLHGHGPNSEPRANADYGDKSCHGHSISYLPRLVLSSSIDCRMEGRSYIFSGSVSISRTLRRLSPRGHDR